MAEQDTPVIFLHQVERRYHQGDATLEILKSAELAVWPGQSVALVAPSGAGKSTLLHIAGLLEHPDAGEVYLDGAATAGLSDAGRTRLRRNEIGFVYQSHHLLPEFSAVENVMLPQMIRGLPRKDAQVRAGELLSYLGLDERLDAPARPNCPAASSSASRSRARSPTRRAFCSPTSRPAISIRAPRITCSTRCRSWCKASGLAACSRPTTWSSPRAWTAA